ncbi:hypothetical protein SAMN05443665_1015119 [Actinomadura meyerae]|jgi:hypothetical protein|uniref:Uncharacterized protein n=1 Tax=Actinomadura meyerae TaxID=240840 RepID=A0A239JPT2_9ACTN|nr:hypothetical protein [Actinomadura meyerae]SNT07825.1 hypothetical protein SAMN05443665_1015119 [Actinomadura meyerae]
MSPHILSFEGRGRADRIRLVLAIGYTLTVLAVSAVVLAVMLFSDDPGFIGVWLIFVTSPLSILGMLAVFPFGELPGPLDTALFFAATTGPGLVQAWLLWPSRKVSAASGPGTGRR